MNKCMNYFFKGSWAPEIAIDVLIRLVIHKGWGFCGAWRLWSSATAYL